MKENFMTDNNNITKRKENELSIEQLDSADEIINKVNQMGYTKDSFWKFLETDNGSRLVEKIANLLDSHKKKENKLEIAKTIIIALIILAIVVLEYLDKFDASLGVLLGTLAGYLFGKKIDT